MSNPLHVVCPECDAVNRVLQNRLGAGANCGKCGKCRAPLFSDVPLVLDERRAAHHIERSRLPLVVDFWADWCAPCRMLMPILASIANDYGGKLLVAKVNTEEEQTLAVDYGIRSLPTVQLFKDGRPADQFMGALPEPQVRKFLERHLPRESDRFLAQARGLLSSGDLAGATRMLEQARQADPENTRVQLVEAGIQAAAGNPQGAQAILDDLPRELADDPEVVNLKGHVGFAALQADSPSEAEFRSRLEKDPKDSDARYRLAAPAG